MAPIYHFTDVTNLSAIIAAGNLNAHRSASCAVDIGDQSIKKRRTMIEVRCGPGGKVGDYVPFYFAPRSPMLFSIKCGNVPGVDPDQRRLVYLQSTTEHVYAAGLSCVIADGNAAAAITRFTHDPAMLAEIVDWPLMRETMWANTEDDGDRRRRRMAEFLVHGAVPVTLITEIGVYDDRMKSQVSAIVGVEPPVRVRGDWYF